MTTETGMSERRAQDILRRAAARDAGIRESSFDAALGESSLGGARADAGDARRRWMVRGLAGVGSAGLLPLGVAFLGRAIV